MIDYVEMLFEGVFQWILLSDILAAASIITFISSVAVFIRSHSNDQFKR